MPKTRTVYKVVREKDNRLWSICVYTDGVAVEYGLGMKSIPKIEGSLLAAFSTLEAAEGFRVTSGERIFEAEAEIFSGTNVSRRDNDSYVLCPERVEMMWSKSQRVKRACADWPHKTVFCKSITLTREILT